MKANYFKKTYVSRKKRILIIVQMESINSTRVIVGFMLMIALLSCNREAFKDRRAYNRVVAKPELAEKVFRELEKTRPCINDTVTLTESDTVTEVQTVEVPGYSVTINDTVYKVLPGKTITKTVTIRDTVVKNITDQRRLNIALDSVNYYKGISIQRQAQIDELKGEVKHERRRGNKWVLYFWLLVAVSAGSHYLRSKLKLF